MNNVKMRWWALLSPPLFLLIITTLGVCLERIGYDFQAIIKMFGQIFILISIFIVPCWVCFSMRGQNPKISSKKMAAIFAISVVGYAIYWMILLTIMVIMFAGSISVGL